MIVCDMVRKLADCYNIRDYFSDLVDEIIGDREFIDSESSDDEAPEQDPTVTLISPSPASEEPTVLPNASSDETAPPVDVHIKYLVCAISGTSAVDLLKRIEMYNQAQQFPEYEFNQDHLMLVISAHYKLGCSTLNTDTICSLKQQYGLVRLTNKIQPFHIGMLVMLNTMPIWN